MFHVVSRLARLTALVAVLSLAAGPVVAAVPTQLRLSLDGRPVGPAEVGRSFCHDRAYPEFRCFSSAAAEQADEQAAAPATASFGLFSVALATTGPCVKVWDNGNFDASAGYAILYFNYNNLHDIGWGDRISSLDAYSGFAPTFWTDPGPSGYTYNVASGAAISYVGNFYNDTFSALSNC